MPNRRKPEWVKREGRRIGARIRAFNRYRQDPVWREKEKAKARVRSRKRYAEFKQLNALAGGTGEWVKTRPAKKRLRLKARLEFIHGVKINRNVGSNGFPGSRLAPGLCRGD